MRKYELEIMLRTVYIILYLYSEVGARKLETINLSCQETSKAIKNYNQTACINYV